MTLDKVQYHCYVCTEETKFDVLLNFVVFKLTK